MAKKTNNRKPRRVVVEIPDEESTEDNVITKGITSLIALAVLAGAAYWAYTHINWARILFSIEATILNLCHFLSLAGIFMALASIPIKVLRPWAAGMIIIGFFLPTLILQH